MVSVLFIFFCKSKFLKEVGRFSIIPGIFNINEPIIFGAPMMLNPYVHPVQLSSFSFDYYQLFCSQIRNGQ